MNILIFIVCSIIIILEVYNLFILKINIRNYKQYKTYSFKSSIKQTGIPIIKIKINNRYYNFLVDSGANINVIDKTIYERELHLHCKDLDKVGGVFSNLSDLQVNKIVTSNFIFHKGLYENIEFQVFDLSYTHVDGYGVTLHGIISGKFCEAYRWIIDYDNLILKIPK